MMYVRSTYCRTSSPPFPDKKKVTSRGPGDVSCSGGREGGHVLKKKRERETERENTTAGPQSRSIASRNNGQSNACRVISWSQVSPQVVAWLDVCRLVASGIVVVKDAIVILSVQSVLFKIARLSMPAQSSRTMTHGQISTSANKTRHLQTCQHMLLLQTTTTTTAASKLFLLLRSSNLSRGHRVLGINT